MFPDGPVALPEIVSRLEHALATSPAEATEISWLEARRGQESTGKRRRDSYELHERSILVRVRESGRTGIYRTGAANLSAPRERGARGPRPRRASRPPRRRRSSRRTPPPPSLSTPPGSATPSWRG